MTAMTDRQATRAAASSKAEASLRLSGERVAAIAALEWSTVLARLEPGRAKTVLALLEWLLGPRQRQGAGQIVEILCGKFLDTGMPLDRYGSSTAMVTAEHDAIARTWLRGGGVTESVYVTPEEVDPIYLASPFYWTAENKRWLSLWIPEVADDAFGIVPELRRNGIVHYLCIPFWLSNGANSWLTFATRRASGFDEQDLLTIAFLLPALATRIDARVGWSTLDKLLRTYVGDEPHNAILAGRAKRGQVSTIRAAMLVADLRDSTGHTANLTALEAVGLFNDLFDCLVPPIEAAGGEVLKYLGDGLLAIFREPKELDSDAADRALLAARGALATIDAFNAAHPDRRAMRVGIALHYGEIAYGNVGSGARLDFTVIGRDVGMASRIAGMNDELGEPLLASAPFVAHLRSPADQLGLFRARGFAEKVEIFRPSAMDPAS